MSLGTEKFGITRPWLASALSTIPQRPEIFSKGCMPEARKIFLAGANQITSIKNWLSQADLIEVGRGRGAGATLTEFGRLVAAKDERGERAWTWWLFHLHLSANPDAWPYCTLFTHIDAAYGAGRNWLTTDDLITTLSAKIREGGEETENTKDTTVGSYLEGIRQAFARPENPLHGLRLLDFRTDREGMQRLRRSPANPADIAVAYATMLFQRTYFADDTTVEARALLARGVARCLGISEQRYRDALKRIHQHPAQSQFLQFRSAVNLDSVQFAKVGDPALRDLRLQGYADESVQWP